MKRLTACAIATLLTATIIANGTFNHLYAPTPLTTFYVDPSSTIDPSYIPESSYTVNVNVSDAKDLWGWQVYILWDPTVLGYVKHTFGDFLADQPQGTVQTSDTDFVEDGELLCSELSFGGDPGVTEPSGWLMSVEFEVLAVGETTIDIDDPWTYWMDSTMEVYGDDPDEMIKENGYFSNIAVHDIAITAVTLDKTSVAPGYSVRIMVDVENQGDFAESFNVTAYYDSLAAAPPQSVTDLAAGANTTLEFVWETTGVAKGTYTIKAEADVVPGETDTADNTFVDGVVTVTIAGDINGDFKVDHLDLLLLASAYGSEDGDPNYISEADINCDGKVDHMDLLMLASNYGKAI